MRGLNAFLFLMNLIAFVRFLIDGCLLGYRANRMEDAYHISCMYIWTTLRQIQIYWYWQMLIQKFGIIEIIYPVYYSKLYLICHNLEYLTVPEHAYFWIDIDIYFLSFVDCQYHHVFIWTIMEKCLHSQCSWFECELKFYKIATIQLSNIGSSKRLWYYI